VSTTTPRRACADRRRGPTGPGRDERGFLSLEWALTLPVLFVLGTLLIGAGAVVRDVLVLQEAARVGARVASTTPGSHAVDVAVRDAAPELSDLHVAVMPLQRRSGDPVEVVVRTTRRYGPVAQRLTARSTARTEPIVTGVPPAAPPWAPRSEDGP
jgi:Flp pilus assembly protein TadG